MSDDYKRFLASKQREAPAFGPVVAHGAVHPSLFDFQRHIVRWAVRKGRAALFADTGLGKTRMQVEWARLVGPSRRTLILAPLSVDCSPASTSDSAGCGSAVCAEPSNCPSSRRGAWTATRSL